MIGDKNKLLCLLAFALTASGCGGGGGAENSAGDPQILVDDTVVTTDDTVIATTEVVDSTETSDAIATSIPLISSGNMDAFLENPLFAMVPTELNDGTSATKSGNFIINPLIND